MFRHLAAFTVFLALIVGQGVVTAADPDDAAAPQGESGKKKPQRLTPRERAAARRAEREAAEKARQEKERKQWLARLEAHGIEPWPEATDDEHTVALEHSRGMVDEVISRLPGTQLYETNHFLFVSNIASHEVAPYVRYLDAMYEWMCKLYGVPAGTSVWLGGKAPIFAFVEQQQFIDFEKHYFQVPAEGVYGLCHQSMGGEVCIVCFRGDNPHDFGQMLVHETSHGFIHRYKSKARLPSWVNEGMAELIGTEMVPRSESVKRKEYLALALLKERRSLGGNFFTGESIEDWHYGVASSLNRFLLNADQRSYVRFVEKLKEGAEWPDALRESYGGTPEQMLAQFGRQIGVPDLQP